MASFNWSNIESVAVGVAARATKELETKSIMPYLVNREHEDEFIKPMQTLNIPKFTSKFTPEDYVAGAALTPQIRTMDTDPLTLDKYPAIPFEIEDTGNAVSTIKLAETNIVSAMATLMALMDKDILATYASFDDITAIDATSTSGPISEDEFVAAGKALDNNDVEDYDRYAILSVDAHAHVARLDAVKNSSYQGSDAFLVNKRGLLPEYLGFQPFKSNKVAVASTEHKNLFFQKQAIAFASGRLPESGEGLGGFAVTRKASNGVWIRVQFGRDILHRSTICVIDTLYGIKVVSPERGVVVRTTVGA
ncbi:MAG: hypothetical protein KGZ97_09710 [Bacteroidetes bacterium]|nr:hypothetical protein [Bacteroidota bacterium]